MIPWFETSEDGDDEEDDEDRDTNFIKYKKK